MKHTERYLDPSLPAEERAADLLARLTPKEKMAQLCCAFLLRGDTERFRTQCRHGIGTVTTLDMRRAETLEEAAQMQRTAQQAVMEQSRFHIPAIFHMEGLCGAFIPGAASLPAGIGRGSSRNAPSALPRHWLRFWIFPEIPGWAARAKPMGRIRP